MKGLSLVFGCLLMGSVFGYGGLSSQHLAYGLIPKPPKPEYYPCFEEDLAQLVSFWKAWEAGQTLLSKQAFQVTGMK